MRRERTLVVILCMHRCGSSLTARLMQRLGMSLGPFDLGEANPSNQYGHFEAQPFVLLNRELQLQQFGFEGDLPDTPEQLRRFLECDGRWTGAAAIDSATLERGRQLVHQLMQSGDVCGFKDPRTVLAWPFWRQVFASLPELRVVPVILLRSPHEVGMSIFCRSQGEREYAAALDATAVHFRRMQEILIEWSGPAAIVRFDPDAYLTDAQAAAELCGLPWSQEALAETYDATCRHFQTTTIAHPAQDAFDKFFGRPAQMPSAGDVQRQIADAAARETILRGRVRDFRDQLGDARRELAETRSERDAVRCELAAARHEIGDLRNVNTHLQQRAAMVQPLEQQVARLRFELELIRGSRTWRVREAVVGAVRFARTRH